jgi:hypothetical protein
MRLPLSIALAAIAIYGSPSLFSGYSANASLSKGSENPEILRLRQSSRVLKVQLVSVNDSALSKTEKIQVGIFGDAPLDFVVRKSSLQKNLWEGATDKLDRFTVRKTGGLYSGQFLIRGRQYVLIPLQNKSSALYEVQGNFECGQKDIDGMGVNK